MKGHSSISGSTSSTRRWPILCAGAAVFAVALVAISQKSLWIDEALTAMKAAQPTLGEWWHAMVQEKASDLQMPFYMACVWACEKVLGSGEWSLRFANVPWFICGAMAFILSFPKANGFRYAALFVTAFSAFAWQCLDEARPYAMQLGAGLFVVAVLRRLRLDTEAYERRERFCVTGFLVGIVVLAGSSLLGMIWVAAALGAMLAARPGREVAALFGRHRFLWVLAGVILLALTAYYIWTIRIGARASTLATTDWRNALWIVYELLGFGGLGPGRLEIRGGGLAAFPPYSWLLGLYAVAACAVIGAAIWHVEFDEVGGIRLGSKACSASVGVGGRLSGRLRRVWRRMNGALVISVAVPATMILVAGVVKHFRVLGRHFAPVAPLVLLAFAFGLVTLWSKRGNVGRAVAVLFCVLSLWSCLSFRWSARHGKDDYRGAAAVARSALRMGQRVWWNAAPAGAQYYKVPLVTEGHADSPGSAFLVVNPTADNLGALPMPQLVITSKSDLYDRQLAVARYVSKHGFREVNQLSAFSIWQRKE